MTLYVGIADAHGLESFISLPERMLEAELAGENGQRSVNGTIGVLSLRAQANRQRHAVIFRVEVDEAEASVIKSLLDAGKGRKALIKLKKCARKVEVGKDMQRSWAMIPNDDLDPYSHTKKRGKKWMKRRDAR